MGKTFIITVRNAKNGKAKNGNSKNGKAKNGKAKNMPKMDLSGN